MYVFEEFSFKSKLDSAGYIAIRTQSKGEFDLPNFKYIEKQVHV